MVKIIPDSCAYLESSPSEGVSLFMKQEFMPGEDQMLACFFSHELRGLWASTISTAALFAVSEIGQEISPQKLAAVNRLISNRNVIEAATDKRFGAEEEKYSFLDVWQEVLQAFNRNVRGQKDLHYMVV